VCVLARLHTLVQDLFFYTMLKNLSKQTNSKVIYMQICWFSQSDVPVTKRDLIIVYWCWLCLSNLEVMVHNAELI